MMSIFKASSLGPEFLNHESKMTKARSARAGSRQHVASDPNAVTVFDGDYDAQ
jgi:hypothetical protein